MVRILEKRLAACGPAFGLVLALAVAPVLAGCSTTLADRLPGGVGLPANAPARPMAANYGYPAVHDMPPPRATEPLTDAEQLRLERDLENARDRLDSEADALEKPASNEIKSAKKPAKPKPLNGKSGETSGAVAKP
jgi:hypothetical protein